VRTVFFDVDTQLDFLYPAGALYVPGAEQILPALARLTQFAVQNKLQIISTADAHSEDDPEFKLWKPHCVLGTLGQHKSAATQAMPGQQIVIEKQKLDAFSSPKLRPLLVDLNADRYVLYGVVTELCVRCAAQGLLQTGARVELVSDAIKSLSVADERSFFQEFQEQGGILTTTAEVLNE
jgi:nicotinamidase/pyrazinamidase